MKRAKPLPLPEIADEPGMAERFQRGHKRALSTPPQHRAKPTPNAKGRSIPKGKTGR